MTTELITHVEVTNTYGGEANYSWVRRHELRGLEGKSDLAIVRRVKREIGWSGHRCRTEKWAMESASFPVAFAKFVLSTFTLLGVRHERANNGARVPRPLVRPKLPQATAQCIKQAALGLHLPSACKTPQGIEPLTSPPSLY